MLPICEREESTTAPFTWTDWAKVQLVKNHHYTNNHLRERVGGPEEARTGPQRFAAEVPIATIPKGVLQAIGDCPTVSLVSLYKGISVSTPEAFRCAAAKMVGINE